MSWRIVVVSNRCKLDYSMNYLVVRGEETKRILIDEIAILMIENNAVSFTGYLLSALVEKKVKVILCDNKRNPQADLIPLYGAHNDSLRIKEQFSWSQKRKDNIWMAIVREKIINQSILLSRNGKAKEAEMLSNYAEEILPGDSTNREGHAAKVYFNALFGMDFFRGDDENPVNAALNYGYALILSAFNREIVSNGYLTQLGLTHKNQFNHFNFSCDLMEPFRIVIDEKVKNMTVSKFEKDEKKELLKVLNSVYEINGSNQTLLNSIKIYTRSVLDAINEDDIKFIKNIVI